MREIISLRRLSDPVTVGPPVVTSISHADTGQTPGAQGPHL